tara:strand:- start:2089 stop:3126 length:1038 start_codon:yes stop_codon:yes gene_type:complete
MAADKSHLKHIDKSYKLKKTDKKTNEGKVVYKNVETGEEHSELSMTLEYPKGSGNWINVPSLVNGRVYKAEGILALLKNKSLKPTSTGHANQDIAVEAAKYRSNNLQDNTGQPLEANSEVNDNRSFVEKLKDSLKRTSNIAGMSYTGDEGRANSLLNDKKNAKAMEEYRQGEADILAKSKLLSEKNREIVNGTEYPQMMINGSGISSNTNQSNTPMIGAKNLDPDVQMQRYDPTIGTTMSSYGPTTRSSRENRTKPIVPEYIDIKNMKPDYGEVPGFKQPLDAKGNKQGYWDADETSDFWKTNAGYEKAQQTWGRDGGTLPQFVKKPERKDIDLDAIKNLFRMNT